MLEIKMIFDQKKFLVGKILDLKILDPNILEQKCFRSNKKNLVKKYMPKKF